MRLALALLVAGAVACGSSIGPVVTDVQLVAGGGIAVQRCYVAHDPWSSRNNLERCELRTLTPAR